ncbi:TetR/AcrR family transcriptional regulator [Nocardia sp. NPDC055029]
MDSKSIARQRLRKFEGPEAADLAIFAAAESLLTEGSLQDLTVSQILKLAKVSHVNFYYYFASIYDVITAMVVQLLDDIYGIEAQVSAESDKWQGRNVEDRLRRMFQLWIEKSAVICAAVEHIHGVPQLAEAWQLMLDRAVNDVAREVDEQRQVRAATEGVPATLVGAVLVCGYERALYVGARAFDRWLRNSEAAVESLIAEVVAAVYGDITPVRLTRELASQDEAVSLPIAGGRAFACLFGRDGDQKSGVAILRAMNELLAGRTLDQLSVTTVVERAGVSPATFYFYFDNMDDAFTVLFDRVAEEMIGRFEKLASADRTDPDRIRWVVTSWLQLDPEYLGVMRNSVLEWPRRPELRRRYLAGMAEMISLMAEMIEMDRNAGIAVAGPPAQQLASTLMWMIERSIAGSLLGESRLHDLVSVAAFLGDLLVSVIYGSGQPSERP